MTAYEYDFFISHASEDKDSAARPLAMALRSLGMKNWFDESVLRIGDSLNEQINAGLTKSRFGILLLSKNFFAKKWPIQEWNGLMARLVSTSDRVILPVWHDIEHEEILNRAPILADRLAARTSDGIDTVAKNLVKAVSSPNIPQTLVGGTWFDREDRDTVYFAGWSEDIVGVYDYGTSSPFGMYRGVFSSGVLNYRWEWLNDELAGGGRMTLLNDSNLLEGEWWYDDPSKPSVPIRYEHFSSEQPTWLGLHTLKELMFGRR